MPYDGLTPSEREVIDRADVDREVNERLPVISRRPHPGGEPDFDFYWLAGITAYWLVPTLVLVLAFPPGALLTTVVFAGFVIQWWNAQTKPQTEWRENVRAYEQSQHDSVERNEARQALRAELARERHLPIRALTELRD